MNKMIVLSCVKDDCYSNNAEHFLAKHQQKEAFVCETVPPVRAVPQAGF